MIKICKNCRQEFKTEDKRQKYCSRKCYDSNRPSNKLLVQCEYCGIDMEIFPSRQDGRQHFCSYGCHDEYQKTLLGTKNPRWIGARLARVCEFCHRTFKPVHSKRKGSGYQQFCSDKCRLESLFEVQIGEDHPSWKGGITSYRRRIESSSEYKQWRLSIYRRDKFRCAMCGSSLGICAHHIKTFADYPKLRMDINNGITLCKECHDSIHHKELLYEKYFYRVLSFLEEFRTYEVEVAV